MGSKSRNKTLKAAIEALKSADYYMKYDYNPDSQSATLYISWLEKTVHIKWNSFVKLTTCTDFEDGGVYGFDYSANACFLMFIHLLSDKYKYGVDIIERSVDWYKLIPCEDYVSSNNLTEVVLDILQEGLKPEHIALAREYQVFEGLLPILSYYFGLKIE